MGLYGSYGDKIWYIKFFRIFLIIGLCKYSMYLKLYNLQIKISNKEYVSFKKKRRQLRNLIYICICKLYWYREKEIMRDSKFWREV